MDSNTHAVQLQEIDRKQFAVDSRCKLLDDKEANFECNEIEEIHLLNSLAELCDDYPHAGGFTITSKHGFLSDAGKDLFQSALCWLMSEFKDFDFGMAYSIASAVFTKVSLNHQPWSASQPANSNFMKVVLAAVAQEEEKRESHVCMDSSGTQIISEPYHVLPRRIWDIRSNRVIPFVLLTIEKIQQNPNSGEWEVIFADRRQKPPPFWAISRSWTEKPQSKMTPVNRNEWPVPLPAGVSLNRVRKEVFQFGAKYIWLDILCLRQDAGPDYQETRRREWKLDVPTIGNVYRIATTIIRYFNGLGCRFSSSNWGDKRHWLQRAWTLQELRSEDITYNGCVPHSIDLWTTRGDFGGKKNITLWEVMTPLWDLGRHLDLDQEKSHAELYRVVKEMSRREASNPRDKLSGLFYLLRTISLPVYLDLENPPVNEAWEECFHVLADQTQLELLFDFPSSGIDGRWFPSWKELLMWPDWVTTSTPPCPEDSKCIYKLHEQLVFRKIGVLRTHYVIALGGPDSTLEKCDEYCVFV